MSFDPSVMRPDQSRILREGLVGYEDGDAPRIAVGRPGCLLDTATMWVMSHGDPMMIRDADGAWILVHFAANNAVAGEKHPSFGNGEPRDAAARMREWLNREGLIRPDDLEV